MSKRSTGGGSQCKASDVALCMAFARRAIAETPKTGKTLDRDEHPEILARMIMGVERKPHSLRTNSH
jgi:hypothetical protein